MTTGAPTDWRLDLVRLRIVDYARTMNRIMDARARARDEEW